MRSLSRFRLITFDVTNTLLQFRTSPGKQYGEIGALFGARCDNNDLAKNFKANWYKMNRDYPNFGRDTKPHMEWQQWWQKLIAGTFAESGAAIPEEKLPNFASHLIELYKTSICWQPCNGSEELLQQLRKESPLSGSKRKLGVIANFDPRLPALLQNTKLDQYLDFALNSYEERAEKPSPEIFQRAMQAAGLEKLRPEECLHVGDGPTTDYLAAKEMGWHAALVHEKSYAYLARKYGEVIDRDHVFPSLYDFHKKISDGTVVW